ncbi:MAG: hypothetical protein ACKV2V_14710 [Blastocatellia bacterium]
MKKTPTSHIPDGPNGGCGRQQDLVSYLYEEACQPGRQSFERHMTDCGDCRAELQAFRGVREDMGAWQLPVAPRLNINVQKGRWEAFRELLEMFPAWVRMTAAGGALAATAMLIFSLLGLHLRVGSDGVAVAFGGQSVSPAPAAGVSATAQSSSASVLTRAEAESLIQQAVTQARTEARAEAQTQLANIEQRMSASYQSRMRKELGARLTAATNRLRNDNQRMIAEINRQPSLREWLFASTEGQEGETANDNQN